MKICPTSSSKVPARYSPIRKVGSGGSMYKLPHHKSERLGSRLPNLLYNAKLGHPMVKSSLIFGEQGTYRRPLLRNGSTRARSDRVYPAPRTVCAPDYWQTVPSSPAGCPAGRGSDDAPLPTEAGTAPAHAQRTADAP